MCGVDQARPVRAGRLRLVKKRFKPVGPGLRKSTQEGASI
jgi:hypothetical protein